MKLQVLVAAMNQVDHSLLDKMNIKSDVIVGNQCNYNSVEFFDYNGFNAKYYNFNERGVGLNRNTTLMRADGDILLFADDDMKYVDNYDEIILNAFTEHPQADILIFNLLEPNSENKRYIIPKFSRINRLNYLRYGAVRIAAKLSSIKNNGIYFNQCFGGGTEHSAGEDNLFLTSCLDKKLKIFAVPKFIAELTEERPSTWNTGNNDKYIKDKGSLYYTMSKKWWKLLCLQDAIRQRSCYKKSWLKVFKIMLSAKEN